LTICIGNKKVIKKLINDLNLDFEMLIKNYNLYTIEYIICNFYNHLTISPYYDNLVLDIAIYTYNFDKIKLIDKIIPSSICTTDAYKHIVEQKIYDIEKWINLNRPVQFMNLRTKKLKCEKISEQDLIRLPIDVQRRYKKKLIPCTCKECGGNGVGYK